MSKGTHIKIDFDKLDGIAFPESKQERAVALDLNENGDLYKTSFRIAMKIKRALRIKGMTQAQLADIMGVDSAVVCRYLSGKANMELKTMIKIEKALSINIIDRTISRKQPKAQIIILRDVYVDAEKMINSHIENYAILHKDKTERLGNRAYINTGFINESASNNWCVAEPIISY